MQLHEYTAEDLKAELRRRKFAKNGEWYYVYEDEDETDPEWMSEIPSFIIINKRTYHLQHKIQETHISNFLKLPKHFEENYASHFKYRGGKDAATAKRQLEKYGFMQLKNPVLGDKALLVEHIKFADKGDFTINWHVEREDMKMSLNNFLMCYPWGNDLNFPDYMKTMSAFATTCGYVAFFFNIYENTCEAAFLPSNVFVLLPNNPYNRPEGEE